MVTGWNLVTAFRCPAPMLLLLLFLFFLISFSCELFFLYTDVLINIGEYPCRACIVKYSVL